MKTKKKSLFSLKVSLGANYIAIDFKDLTDAWILDERKHLTKQWKKVENWQMLSKNNALHETALSTTFSGLRRKVFFCFYLAIFYGPLAVQIELRTDAKEKRRSLEDKNLLSVK